MADPNDLNAVNPYATMASILQAAPNYVNPQYATPDQIKSLRTYGEGLINQQQPVRRWTQGLAEMARALIGGNAEYQADTLEQKARADAQANLTPFGGVVSPGTSNAAPAASARPMAYAGADADSAPNVSALINGYAKKYGIDPSIATQFFAQESSLNPNAAGDKDAKGNATSFNVPQLHVTGDPKHPAMGDQFIAATGLDPRDPKNAPQAIDYALRRASKEGWGAWANTRDKLGYDNYTGIHPQQKGMLENSSAFAGVQPINPIRQQMADVLLKRQSAPPQPVQVAQNGMPVSPEQYARVMTNPFISPDVKSMANELVKPQLHETATGQVLPSYQMQPVGAPIVNKGVRVEQAPGSVPAIIGGTPGAPTNTVVPPQIQGQPTLAHQPNAAQQSATPNVFGPGSPMYDMQQQKAAADAQVAATAAKSAAAQQRFQKTQEEGPALLAAAYPLRQAQAILEKSGGTLPTGKEAQNLMGHASLVNMVSTWLGHPLTDEDSRLTSLELLNKYGRQVADAQASSLTGHPTNMQSENAAHTSPNVELSGPANLHLVDNLIRLNALQQKKAQFEHDYYLKHGQSPDAYDNFTQDWQKEITDHPVPLSKYGRQAKKKDGTPVVYVPSTDPSGFSAFPVDAPEFKSSVMTPEK